MTKGIDYIGITVSFYCHDGAGNFVLHRRSDKCRDEHGRWDFGGGGLKFGETIEEGLLREIKEEFQTKPVKHTFMGFDEIFREHDGQKTHWIGFRYKVHLDRDEVKNGEPDKHDEVDWFTLDDLPTPLHSQLASQLVKYDKILRDSNH